MKLSEAILQEFDVEMKYTRMCLERVPEDKLSWKPHDKSGTLGWLATFLAVMSSWGNLTLDTDFLDWGKGGSGAPPREARSVKELLEMFDGSVAKARASLAKATDAQLVEPWSIKKAGATILTQPRYLVFQTYVLNHAVHHRAQLGVYLRLLGVAVPAIYSASADEQGGMFMPDPAPAG